MKPLKGWLVEIGWDPDRDAYYVDIWSPDADPNRSPSIWRTFEAEGEAYHYARALKDLGADMEDRLG